MNEFGFQIILWGLCLGFVNSQDWRDQPPPPPRGTPYYNRGGQPYNNRDISHYDTYGPGNRNSNPSDRRYPYDDTRGGIGGYQAPGVRPSEKDFGDKRCQSAITDYHEFEVKVEIPGAGGVIHGKYAYLCDGPEYSEHSRPKPGRPAYIYRNISVFLGIPYAEAPTHANNLRFRVSIIFWISLSASYQSVDNVLFWLFITYTLLNKTYCLSLPLIIFNVCY